MHLSVAIPYLNPVYTHEPVCFVVNRLLKSNRLRVDISLLQEKLSGHPYYPSLLSISDVLNDLGVPHQAYRCNAVKLSENLTLPALAYIRSEGGFFAVVEQVRNGKVKIFTEKGDVRHYALDAFSQVWDGTVLELDTPEDDPRLKTRQHNDTYPFYIRYGLFFGWLLLAVWLLQRSSLFSGSPVQGLLLLLNVGGLAVSWLLLLQHLNSSNVLVKQLCQSKSQDGCSSVLSNGASQLTPWLSMAEAGLLYFAGATALLLVFHSPALYYYLAFAAPVFSLFAIYLQAVVIKQWCRLCNTVHGLLLISFLVALWSYTAMPGTPVWPGISQFFVFLFPALLWVGIKPAIKLLKEGKHYKQEYKKLKSNPEVFNSLLSKQVRVHIPEELKAFSFGNTQATHELVFVSNPYCGPCARAHSILHEWLEGKPDFRITFIFFHQTDEKDKKRQFVEHIAGVRDKEKLKAVLHEWFESDKQDVERWAAENMLGKTVLPYDETRLRHWLDMANVQATPTFFVNGYKLPDSYRLEDIRYLVNEVK